MVSEDTKVKLAVFLSFGIGLAVAVLAQRQATAELERKKVSYARKTIIDMDL